MMNEVRRLAVAGKTCLAVTTKTDDGWRAAGFFGRQTVIVEPFDSEDEAVLAWQLAALGVKLQQE
jgi:hypothetical protein